MKRIMFHVNKRLNAVLLVCLSLLLITSCQKSGLKDQQSDNTSVVATDEISEADASASANAYASEALQSYKSQRADIQKTIQATLAVSTDAKANKNTIFILTKKLPFFKSLAAAIQVTGLGKAANDDSAHLTLFAPNDEAFAKLPAPFNTPEGILAIKDPSQLDWLRTILQYHAVKGEISFDQIPEKRSSLITMKPRKRDWDNTIFLSWFQDMVQINGTAQVIMPDVWATNGVIQVVDNVLMYPTQSVGEYLESNPNFKVLTTALIKTNLLDSAKHGNFTIFAPTDEAFRKSPKPYNSVDQINAITKPAVVYDLSNLVKYHILAGHYFGWDLGFFYAKTTLAKGDVNKIITATGVPVGFVKGMGNVGYAKIWPGNIVCTNGVIHIIPALLRRQPDKK